MLLSQGKFPKIPILSEYLPEKEVCLLELEPLLLVGVFIVGIIAGFFNTIGGGGSLLVLPFLSFLGMDMAVVNGTNRIGIVIQSFAGAEAYRRQGVLDIRSSIPLAGITTLGSIAGTFIAVNIDKEYLNLAVAVLISVIAVLLVFKPKMWEECREPSMSKVGVFLAFFAIGVHGGFIQAGVGFFMTWGLALAVGVDLVRGNAMKMIIVGVYNIVSLGIFFYKGLVNIPVGLVLAAGNTAGAIIGAKFAVERGNRQLRWILAAIIIVSAAKMIWDVAR